MTLKIALAGAGAFGIKHLDGLKNIADVEVVSLIGRELGKTQEVADKFREGQPVIMNIEDWEVWYSRDLMNMWFSLRSYTSDAGVSNFVMPFATYSKFVEFCYANSDGMRNSYPS
jgi:hypothetical protein